MYITYVEEVLNKIEEMVEDDFKERLSWIFKLNDEHLTHGREQLHFNLDAIDQVVHDMQVYRDLCEYALTHYDELEKGAVYVGLSIPALNQVGITYDDEQGNPVDPVFSKMPGLLYQPSRNVYDDSTNDFHNTVQFLWNWGHYNYIVLGEQAIKDIEQMKTDPEMACSAYLFEQYCQAHSREALCVPEHQKLHIAFIERFDKNDYEFHVSSYAPNGVLLTCEPVQQYYASISHKQALTILKNGIEDGTIDYLSEDCDAAFMKSFEIYTKHKMNKRKKKSKEIER